MQDHPAGARDDPAALDGAWGGAERLRQSALQAGASSDGKLKVLRPLVNEVSANLVDAMLENPQRGAA
jgi:hypothetical protein